MKADFLIVLEKYQIFGIFLISFFNGDALIFRWRIGFQNKSTSIEVLSF